MIRDQLLSDPRLTESRLGVKIRYFGDGTARATIKLIGETPADDRVEVISLPAHGAKQNAIIAALALRAS